MMTKKENFDFIYQQNSPGIRKLCFNYTGDKILADDLWQETFIVVWDHFEKFRGDAKISTWIYRIAVNICLTSIKKRKRENWVSDENLPSISDEKIKDNTKEITFLHQCISELKEVDRIIITLVLEEKLYDEISEIVGISENNLRVKIHRIKKELTEKFKKNGRF